MYNGSGQSEHSSATSMYDLFRVPETTGLERRTTQNGGHNPTINARGTTKRQTRTGTDDRPKTRGRCNACYLIVGVLVVLGILILLGLAITAIVLASQTLSTSDEVDDLTDNCFSIRALPGEDLSSSVKGHVCFQCGSGKIEAVLDYEFQSGSSTESFDLINTVLGMSSIMNGFEKISLCGNISAPLCPAFKPTCAGSCKWSGRLSLTGDNQTPIDENVCQAVRNNPSMYALFSGTDMAAIANIAQLKN